MIHSYLQEIYRKKISCPHLEIGNHDPEKVHTYIERKLIVFNHVFILKNFVRIFQVTSVSEKQSE